ncbi:hypothetical protein DHW03_10510 [Pedobacter yonginense]|uniref:CHAT domain-containing protein n=1 Tax=Pedobacter yonginense TaxID=651869 RepID=A0A317ENQ6_9SPHI|nr:hypothetical protein [Pedobacter yonginense]PWS27985.1 hypothetical protein DHW03_10510 [Pedobacter yonginense]
METKGSGSDVRKKTIPGVFIIESLEFEDERGSKEGEILYGILQLSGIPVEYVYVRSYDEFVHFINQFVESNFRFLHISCHGNNDGIKLTLEEISNNELGSILHRKLKYRRLFLSACAAVNENMAFELFPKSGCNSLIGPNKKVKMKEVAIFWASFYHLMFKLNHKAMKKKYLISTLDALVKLYAIPIKYFKTSTIAPYFSEQKLTQTSTIPVDDDLD